MGRVLCFEGKSSCPTNLGKSGELHYASDAQASNTSDIITNTRNPMCSVSRLT